MIPPPRSVTPDEFAAIECNRCGDCCEAFTLPSPLQMALRGYLDLDDPVITWARSLHPDRRCVDVSRRERAVTIEWIGSLIPLDGGPHAPGEILYRCPAFRRLSPDQGECQRYGRRPFACRDFPNGHSVLVYDRCAWAVQIQEAAA